MLCDLRQVSQPLCVLDIELEEEEKIAYVRLWICICPSSSHSWDTAWDVKAA